MNINTFSKRLRETRRSKNLTQAQLAKLSGVTAATISAYESTDNKKGCNPSLENALKLAEALCVSLDWLCDSVVNKKKVDTVDFLKMLVKLSEVSGISIDTVYSNNPQISEIVPNAFILSYVSHNGSYPLLSFENSTLSAFLSEWGKMKDLYISGTIDESLYNLWLEKQYLEIEQKERTEKEKPNKGGESNGNNS